MRFQKRPLDSRKTQNTLGWKPRHDDSDGIVKPAFDWDRLLNR
jgi:hypothetical protein